jgi:diadenylate cyclase
MPLNLEFLSALASDPIKLLVNLIDILIVAYVFYRILLLIRNTRAEQLLKGLVILLILSLISRWAGMATVNWLLNKVWTGIFIALPVVFQPELRRALEQLGRGSFFTTGRSTNKTSDLERNIDEIVKAAVSLSADRIGALIVWERETGLKDFQDIGVPVDAEISRELMINIFTPNTPLHDGAVVIRNGRVHIAGAFLPLSDNPTLDKRMGTRHRAAVGVTEVSDALAIVVSEETGSLALAREGRIDAFLTEKSLREILMQELGVKALVGQVFWRRRSNDAN